MGFNYQGSDGNLDGRLMNHFLGRQAPQPNSTQFLSGGAAQTTSQLSGGAVYVIVGSSNFHIACSGATFSATAADLYWPANEPFYHYARAGQTDFVSVAGSPDTLVYVSLLKEKT